MDGFDEISVKLDPDTVTDNIRKLAQCYEEFHDSKILVTSRSHFFESTRDQERLLGRIGFPQIVVIAEIARRRRIDYLDEFAKTIGARDKLLKLRTLYDPIGMAGKPLFLQMIKETLQDLPQDQFSEVILYNTYIDRSLKRKIEDLEDESLSLLREELVENLLEILEQVAVALHRSAEGFVYLKDLSTDKGIELAEVLWRISDVADIQKDSQDTREDATARIGVRSLLKSVVGPEHDRWPVDFFHRSMREFFVARAIVRALSSDIDAARHLLSSLPLQPEILHFAVSLMEDEGEKGFDRELLSLARSAVLGSRSDLVGGNAITLLYGLTKHLPGTDWSDLNLDFAYLPNADLSGMCFARSSMRNANLDNANLENADFEDVDLTGVRLEETAQVDAITVPPAADRIIAAYGDGTIREWTLVDDREASSSNTLVERLDGRAEHLVMLPSGQIVVVAEGYLLTFKREKNRWVRRTSFRMKTKFRFVVLQPQSIVLLHEGAKGGLEVLVVDPVTRTVRRSAMAQSYGPCDAVELSSIIASSGSEGMIVIRFPEEEDGTPTVDWIEATDVSSIAGRREVDRNRTLIATGHRDGHVRIWSLADSETGLNLEMEQQVHDGVVTSVSFLGDERVASGGDDRSICLTDVQIPDGRDHRIRRLQLTLRCSGMRIRGVQGSREYALLERRLSGQPDEGS